MKKLCLSLFAIMFASQSSLTVLACPVSWSPEYTQSVAGTIVKGQRPPLSAAELAGLAPDCKRRLLADLVQARTQERQDEADHIAGGGPGNVEDSVASPESPSQKPAGQAGDGDNPDCPSPALADSQKDFIDQVAPLAQAAGQKYDLFPSLLIAQAALESDWGRSQLGRKYHNLFGIKGSSLFSVILPTQEEANGRLISQPAAFRTYKNWQESIDDYGRVLSQPLYAGVHRHQASNYRQASRALVGKYATDSHYDQKLNRLIQAYGLDKYDRMPDRKPSRQVSRKTADVKAGQVPDSLSENKNSETGPKPASRQVAWPWPVLGGCGSVGLWQLLRRRFW